MVRLQAVVFHASDWHRLAVFYKDVVALPLAEWNEDEKRAQFGASGTLLWVSQSQEGAVSGGITLDYLCENVDVEVARLAHNGLQPLGDIELNPEGYSYARYLDPEGNRFNLYSWGK